MQPGAPSELIGSAPAPSAAGVAAAQGSVLRLLTCGSVDDGKSTFIGRLLHDCGAIADDTMRSLEQDSRSWGTTGGIDFALLVDGLQSEREQGITIDVAYRYFATRRRKFILADAPGHEQYTRNMITGASRCDLAAVLVDARKGILRQTRRHSFIVHLLGIRHVVLAVNKMDLVDYDERKFQRICAEYRRLAESLGLDDVTMVPISALNGANVTRTSRHMPWYAGPTVLEHLESVVIDDAREAGPLRLPVQLVLRPSQDARGYAGTIASGRLTVGDRITVLPSGVGSTVAAIRSPGGSCWCAKAGDAVVVTLADQIDVGRGSVISDCDHPADAADQCAADVMWFGDKPLLKSRPYILQMGPQSTVAQVSEIKHVLDTGTLEPSAGGSLAKNGIARCDLLLSKPLVMTPYDKNRELGGFILIDRTTHETVGAGMIALHRSLNIHWQALDVTRKQRAAIKGQRACCLWFTGLSGSGKSTLANLLEKRLHALGHHTAILDGDNLRHGLNRDLGFTDADRVENIRRAAEVARLMADAGLIVLVSFISPFRAERQFARERFEADEFLEIYVDTPLEICEARDPKGLYRQARAGTIQHFTGISSAYEPPLAPDLSLAAGLEAPNELVGRIIAELMKRQVITA